ncbi:TrkA C-terminal domain-containing protein [bacterium]|nr:TrkA C-terminal domain-containing protein [bacterium]
MNFDVALIIILGVIAAYSLLINIYTILFQLSGLSWAKSRFQVISLLTNSGFTTRESETITSNRLRRKLAIAVMLTGNIFSIVIISLFINLIFSFNGEQIKESIWVIAIALAVFIFLIILFRLPKINEAVSKLLKKASHKILKDKNKNVVTVFDEIGEEAVCEVIVYGLPEYLQNKTLEDIQFTHKYGINILSISRNNRSIKVNRSTVILPGDIVLVFGNLLNIKDLFLKEKIIKPQEIEKHENSINLVDNYGDNAIVEVSINRVPNILKDKMLFETNIREHYHVFILGIIRLGNSVEIEGSTKIEQYDYLTVFGPYSNIKKIFSSQEEI